jgi:hypothetical protein
MLTYLAFFLFIHTIKKVIELFNKIYNKIINYIEDIDIDFIKDIMIYVILILYTIYMIYISLTNSLDFISQIINSDDIILSSTLLTSIKGLFKGKNKQEYIYTSDITREEYQLAYDAFFNNQQENDEDFELIQNTNINSNLAVNDLNVNNT